LTGRGLTDRDPHPLHASETGKNWSIGQGVGQCCAIAARNVGQNYRGVRPTGNNSGRIQVYLSGGFNTVATIVPDGMGNLTVDFPDRLSKRLSELVEDGSFKSKNEAVRYFVRNGIQREQTNE